MSEVVFYRIYRYRGQTPSRSAWPKAQAIEEARKLEAAAVGRRSDAEDWEVVTSIEERNGELSVGSVPKGLVGKTCPEAILVHWHYTLRPV